MLPTSDQLLSQLGVAKLELEDARATAKNLDIATHRLYGQMQLMRQIEAEKKAEEDAAETEVHDS